MGMPETIHRFTVDEFQRMADAGVFHEDDRVELIDGQVVEMTPIGDRHAACVRRLIDLLATDVRDAAMVDAQNPVVLDDYGAPQPDVAVLRRRADRYPTHPRAGDVFLLIEVADTSVTYDREVKIPLYAGAAIAEAWLVNLPGDCIDVFREPADGRYTDVRTARRGETVAPLAFPDRTLRVDDVLG